MTTRRALHYLCDSCRAVDCYGTGGLPRGWVEAAIRETGGGESHPLHLCPECAARAAAEWLPDHTWWGSTENWRKDARLGLAADAKGE